MTYAMKPLSCDPSRISGMSERMIISHYENNYGGAVKRLNLIDEKLAELDYAHGAGLPDQWPEARRAHRDQFDDPARAVLRWPRR